MSRQISLCITTWMRTEMTMRSFDEVLHDDRISEIIIVDDASDMNVYDYLVLSTGGMDKVRVFRNAENLGCYFNKREAIRNAVNEFVICLDSDNILPVSYLDRIFERPWHSDIIFAPDFGEPVLDYTEFSSITITKENVNLYLGQGRFDSLLNTFNLFINRDRYLTVFDADTEPWTSDSIYMSYLWLKTGGRIKVVSGMRYTHSIHSGSHYQNNCHKNPGFYDNLIQKIKELK